MKNIKTLFKHRLSVLSHQLLAAEQQKSPAMWLYQNDARTSLFYLEAMCRVLGAAGNAKRFDKLKAQFKMLEDALGELDYYDAWWHEFSANKAISADVLMAIDHQRDLAELRLNGLLKKEAWLLSKSTRVTKIKKQIKKINWPSDTDFVAHAHDFYQHTIADINAHLAKPLVDIEADVHELRRDVRWLSIYPQAFKGFFSLKPARVTYQKFGKYLSAEVVNSPFNRLQAADDVVPLLLNQNNFYAMSWLIATLGTIKDQGLRLELLTHALQTVEGLPDDAAQSKALELLGQQQATHVQLISAANFVAQKIKRDAVLSGLLA